MDEPLIGPPSALFPSLLALSISPLKAYPIILLKRLLTARHSMRKGHPHHCKVIPKKLERKPLFAIFEGCLLTHTGCSLVAQTDQSILYDTEEVRRKKKKKRRKL
jgi:hypothetical protein